MLGWVDTLVQGILLGGLYSLYATGLSVIFGIMRLVNLAHGDLIVLAAFLMLALAAIGVPISVMAVKPRGLGSVAPNPIISATKDSETLAAGHPAQTYKIAAIATHSAARTPLSTAVL